MHQLVMHHLLLIKLTFPSDLFQENIIFWKVLKEPEEYNLPNR